MEFTLSELIGAFGISLVVGVVLAVIYEPFRVLHKLGLSKPLHYFILDYLYIIICAFVTYFVCLVLLEGCVRLFVIAGEILGFSLFYFTIRPVLDIIYNPVIKVLKKIFVKLLKITRKIVYNIYDKFVNMFKCIKSKVIYYVWKRKTRKSNTPKRVRKHSGNTTSKEKA